MAWPACLPSANRIAWQAGRADRLIDAARWLWSTTSLSIPIRLEVKLAPIPLFRSHSQTGKKPPQSIDSLSTSLLPLVRQHHALHWRLATLLPRDGRFWQCNAASYRVQLCPIGETSWHPCLLSFELLSINSGCGPTANPWTCTSFNVINLSSVARVQWQCPQRPVWMPQGPSRAWPSSPPPVCIHAGPPIRRATRSSLVLRLMGWPGNGVKFITIKSGAVRRLHLRPVLQLEYHQDPWQCLGVLSLKHCGWYLP